MKSVRSTTVIAIALFSLAACSQKSETAPQASEASPAPSHAQPVANAQAADSGAVFSGTGFRPLPGFSPAASTQVRCSLDTISGNLVSKGPVAVQTGTTTTFDGWSATPELEAPKTFELVLSGNESYAIEGATGRVRADVARGLKSEGMRRSGYKFDADLHGVVPGEYSVFIVQDWQGAKIQCKTKATLVVTAG